MKYLISLIGLVLVFSFWFFYLRDLGDRSLMEEGKNIATQVEAFRQLNGRLPLNLREINLPETESGPLYYNKISDTDYIIHYSTGFDETHTYYSDKKDWEVIYH